MTDVKVKLTATVRRTFITEGGTQLFIIGSDEGRVWISAEEKYTALHPAAIPALIAALQAAATEASTGKENEG